MSLCFYKSEETFSLETVQMLYIVNHRIAQKNPNSKADLSAPYVE